MSSSSDGCPVVAPASSRPHSRDVAETKDATHQQTSLPIFAFKEQIIASVRENKFLVVIGETGSGKTTQLCQYLLDAEIGGPKGVQRVAITQPRRVAAIGSAHRVASERGGAVGGEVGYMVRARQHTAACCLAKPAVEHTAPRDIAGPARQLIWILHQNKVKKATNCHAPLPRLTPPWIRVPRRKVTSVRPRFLTDGCLLRECLDSPSLDSYSIIILVSLQTDVAAWARHEEKRRG